ncbi:hypothetical protein SEA_WHEELBITE_37 [Arthrobacter phage Wheelbite]|uniref:Uncharacterized protein n=1 Tax=Arthrobacter phage Wheelbite TaxID=2015873 RepID=A0A222ZJC4_9CAUD|nr:hypothetical protein KMD23_gp37 [Arthrobacter phage Wheelbite]ASR84130.1 hypothetical protein SEA_WHEELBITE_37 [Arthrobacter phage Wheelbite]
MPLRNATIESNGSGHGTITMDGMDLSQHVGRVEFVSAPGQADSLILHTFVAPKIEAMGVKVGVDEGTRNMLAALGWTAPAEDLTPTMDEVKEAVAEFQRQPLSAAIPTQSRIENPQGFHQPTLREALDSYLESLPQRYTPVVKGIRALMSYYPVPKSTDPYEGCRCFTG